MGRSPQIPPGLANLCLRKRATARQGDSLGFCSCDHPDCTIRIRETSNVIKGGFAPFEIPEFGSSEPIAVKTRSCCRRIKFWFAGDGYLRFQCKTGRIRKEAHRNAPTTTWSAVHMMQEHLKRECQDRMKQREKQQVERKLQAKKEEQQRRGESGTRFQEAKRKAAGKKGVEAWQSSQQ